MEQYKTVAQLNRAIKDLKDDGYRARGGLFVGKPYYENYNGDRALVDVENKSIQFVHADEIHLINGGN